MAHHVSDLRELESLRRALGVPAGLGATGQYPFGKLCDADEGEIKIAVAADPKKPAVVIDFGKPVALIGFTPDQAVDIAQMLIDKATEARGIDVPV